MDDSGHDKNDHFLRLYVENEEALRGFVRSSLVPTLEDAREVMQDVAAVLWRKFDQLDSPEDFRRWAFGVAKFEALAFRRDRARDRHVFSDNLIALLEEEAAASGEQSRGEERALENCLEKLPRAQRELVEVAYGPGARIDRRKRPAALRWHSTNHCTGFAWCWPTASRRF
ncbi:MAG: RNA polymerase sigma-70 factor (ECF subfamily) [Verrucomicrobiales bacterium]|jgi:RNA polymerase sigma-70 factor (ECF subfamily)